MNKFAGLINKTRVAMQQKGVNMTNIKVFRDEENGRYYLSGEYEMPSVFGGVVTRQKHTRIEELFRMNEEHAFELFVSFFSANRAAYCNASDEQVLEFGLRHPDTFPVA